MHAVYKCTIRNLSAWIILSCPCSQVPCHMSCAIRLLRTRSRSKIFAQCTHAPTKQLLTACKCGKNNTIMPARRGTMPYIMRDPPAPNWAEVEYLHSACLLRTEQKWNICTMHACSELSRSGIFAQCMPAPNWAEVEYLHNACLLRTEQKWNICTVQHCI